jgi:ABC-2 type transport system ATP-binding protein
MGWGGRDLVVDFGDDAALDGVTLELAPGSITVVVGGDGAGKSTLLRVLAGALDPTTGEVTRPDPRRIGYVPASPGGYADLTVLENLSFAAAAYGAGGDRDRIEELLRRTGLGEARRRLARHLSGGMRRKLGVAMALVHRPDLLVLDEPTTGVDPVSRVDLWRMFAGAAATGSAVVMATTYVDEAERAANVLVLDRGRPLLGGPPEEVTARVPGVVLEASRPSAGLEAWRRGPRWRAWSPEGRAPEGTREVRPDLEDAVMVASLARSDTERAA